ncbi:twin-arginine translocase subunit TatC [Halobium salinum]|uniref:Sec-independent protein translocase protein TatC n=1 Tax=Halobium salinum TaxID=1364940 RepID=A0ABD5PFR8_9EURY|nr:twin-arginine translocase subunit TatC [Halobium salinum]
MSSALDEDTRRAIDEGRETAGAMLRSAQKDLQKVFIFFLVGFLGTFYALRLYVWNFLRNVTISQMDEVTVGEFEIIAQTPFDVLLLQAKISLVAGIIVALPSFIYFAREPLRARGYWPQSPVAPWKLVTIALTAVVLFLAGMAYGYLLFFPLMFEFLAGNALAAGFKPRYSIVLWAQFIFLLTVSFGLAAQMPLAITGLSYSEIVPYETFREKWRYAVVAIFVFGAVFSPPDPFTQIMWAVPLIVLYGFSLYLAKMVVTAKRGSESMDLRASAAERWNVVVGAFAAGVAAVYLFYTRGGVVYTNDLLASIGSSFRLYDLPVALPESVPALVSILLAGALLGLLLALVALLYVAYAALGTADDGAGRTGRVGDPAGIDLSGLDAAGVEAAPPEAFESMTEEEALALAREAMEADDREKARTILDRYDEHNADEVEEGASAEAASGDATATGASGSTGGADPVFRTADGIGESFVLGAARVNWRRRLGSAWNVFAGLAVLVGGLAYALLATPLAVYLARTVRQYVIPYAPATYEATLRGFAEALPPTGPGFATATVAGAAVGVALVAVLLFGLLFVLSAAWQAGRDPGTADLDRFSASQLRNAPPSVFAGMTEQEALGYANLLNEQGRSKSAQAVLDRYDEAQTAREEATPDPGTVEDRATRAGGSFMSELTEGETDEDDIGGYYTDIRFILDSITSKTFRIVGLFMAVLAGTFYWLYSGGIGDVRVDFLSRLPTEINPDEFQVIALHPVEALIFEVKFSTLVAAAATIPLIAYYAWPALRERNFVRGHRNVIFGWLAFLLLGLVGGFALGYSFVAPTVISYLVEEAVRANMIISYRISDFFWLIFYTTIGIGLLADVPVLMVLLNTAGVTFNGMRGRWREVTVGIMTFAALFTPADIITMFMVTVPLMVAYGVGLGILYVLTLGGRRDLAPRKSENENEGRASAD